MCSLKAKSSLLSLHRLKNMLLVRAVPPSPLVCIVTIVGRWLICLVKDVRSSCGSQYADFSVRMQPVHVRPLPSRCRMWLLLTHDEPCVKRRPCARSPLLLVGGQVRVWPTFLDFLSASGLCFASFVKHPLRPFLRRQC